MKSFFFALLTITVAWPCLAQSGDYPTTQELRDVLRRADALFSRFEQVTDRINFSRWRTTYGVIQNAKHALDVERASIRALKPMLGRLETSGGVPASDLLDVLDEAHSVNSLAIALSFDSVDPVDTSLAADLADTAKDALTVATSVKNVLSRYVTAQEVELAACRQSRQ